MNEELESLELDGLDFDEIERGLNASKYSFPTITVGEQTLYFNTAFAKYLKGAKYVNFRISTEYIVIHESEEKSKYSFRLGKFGNGAFGCIHPSNMKEKKIKRGVYKIYRFKDGFAFKRYEPLEVYGG